MRIEWVNQKRQEEVIVFFNGWGMDFQSVRHLKTEKDFVHIYDYRSVRTGHSLDLSKYDKIYLIAWSMGVWAAANTIKQWDRQPDKSIALNGTERPIDNNYGIPEKFYELTEKGMDEKGREKFFNRMMRNKDEILAFPACKPMRPLEEQCEELRCVHKQYTELKNCIQWNKVYIGENDVIFPAINQLNWWNNKAQIQKLASGHYPFYNFQNWDELINC